MKLVKEFTKLKSISFPKTDGMNSDRDVELGHLQPEMQAIANAIGTLAEQCQGNSLALLSLLRMLEQVHRQIREGVFQESLPDNRQALYALLKDIEEEGGWPYIDRILLRSLLTRLSESPLPNQDDPAAQTEAGE